MKDLVYISHPSGGLEENTKDIERIVSKLYEDDTIYENYCIVSPVHNFGFMYETTDYHRGLDYCINLLEHCDIMLVFGDYKNNEYRDSVGCNTEISFCKKNNKTFYICKDIEDAKNFLNSILLKNF